MRQRKQHRQMRATWTDFGMSFSPGKKRPNPTRKGEKGKYGRGYTGKSIGRNSWNFVTFFK